MVVPLPQSTTPPHSHDGEHWCKARLRATCTACRREITMCTASQETVDRIKDQTFRCPDCAFRERRKP